MRVTIPRHCNRPRYRLPALHALVLAFCLFNSSVYAQCISPSGVSGDKEWFSADGTYKFCINDAWVPAAESSILTSCSTEADWDYDATEKAFKQCDGTDWRKIGCDTSPGVGGCIYWSQIGTPSTIPYGSGGRFALATLDSQTVALITAPSFGGNPKLGTFRWNGSSWSQLGTSLTVSGIGFRPDLAALDNQTVALISGTYSTDTALRTYRWNGSSWAQIGSTLSPATTSQDPAAITALDSQTVAVVETRLRTYRWNGSVWSEIGTNLNIGGISYPALATLDSQTVAFIDGGGISSFGTNYGNHEMRTYRWNGSSWSQLGNSLPVYNTNQPALAELDNQTVAFIDEGSSELRTYSWDGTDWLEVDSGLPQGAESSPSLTSLDSSTVVLIRNPSIITSLTGIEALKTFELGSTCVADGDGNHGGSAETLIATSFDANPNVFLYKLSDGSKVPNVSIPPTNGVKGVAFSPDGSLMVVQTNWASGPKTFEWYSTSNWSKLSQLTGPSMGTSVGQMSFSSDGSIFAFTTGPDQPLFLYNVSGTDPSAWVKLPDPAYMPNEWGGALAFSPDDSLLAVSYRVSPYITIYDTSDWSKLPDPATVPSGEVYLAEFSPDGSMLALMYTTGSGTSLILYDTSDWSQIADPPGLPSPYIGAFTFSPDSSLFAVSGMSSPYVTLYDTTTWSKLPDLPNPPSSLASSLDFSGDGSKLYVSSGTSPYLEIYNTSDWSKNTSNPLSPAPPDVVLDVAFSPIPLNTPTGTTGGGDSLCTPMGSCLAEGQVDFDTSEGMVKYCDGANWYPIAKAEDSTPPTWVTADGATIVDIPEGAGFSYTSFSETVEATDNGGIVTFTKVSGPSWANVATDGTVTGTSPNTADPAGSEHNFDITIRAEDLDGNGVDRTFNIKITSTVLCTYYYNRGMLPEHVFRGDVAYSETVDRLTIKAYQAWAIPLIQHIDANKGGWTDRIVFFFIERWANEMSFRMGYGGAGNMIGWTMREIGEPLHYLAGYFMREETDDDVQPVQVDLAHALAQ